MFCPRVGARGQSYGKVPMKKFIALCTIVIIIFAGAQAFLYSYLNRSVGIESAQMIEVKKGQGLGSVALTLERAGIIESARVFTKVGQLKGLGLNIKYGEYQIEPKDTYREVFDKIASGDSFKYEVTFVEGDHYYKYARQIEEKGLAKQAEFVSLVRDKTFIQSLIGIDAKTLEGYLFPETYHFAKNDGARTIIKTMVKNFLKETEDLNFEKLGMTRHQVVTLASIIEKETGAAHERTLISSVFHNRLKKRMRLQTDPTILYGIMDQTGVETNNIRKKDILAPTPYNTYTIRGLPPGPISNPGLASIKAALNPKNTDYLYFVSQNDGTHVFTTNYKSHLKAVQKFQMNPAMRRGRSWRDLNKKRN